METNQYGLKRSKKDNDILMKYVLIAVSSLTVLIISLIIIFTLVNSGTAIANINLWDFFFGESWKPSSGEYGALSLILGTLLVTLGAMVFAVPVGLAAAIYISEIAPSKFRNIMKPICEVLSGIPSVVYGFFGLMVILPFLRDLFPDQLLFGSSWLAGSLVLGIMALPTVISVSEDAIHAVPRSYREASRAMGATRWETIIKVIVPAAISGISSAIILGVGRAIGETMAVMMVTGNTPMIPDPLWNIFSIVSTLTGTIASQLPESVAGSVSQSALFLLGVVLMVMVLIINVCSRYIVKNAKRKTGDYDPKSSLAYKLFGREQLIPRNEDGFITKNKGKIMQIGAYVLIFVFVYMMGTLFTGDGMSIVAGIIVAAAVFAGSKMYSKVNSTTVDKMANGMMICVMGFVILLLAIIVGYIVVKGLPAISWEFLTAGPTNGGRSGGIYPAIIGTLELIVGTALIAFPIGILTGVYLSEYSKDTRFTRIIREAIDLLNGTPSIVFGMFGSVLLVTSLGLGFSMIGGWITLAFMILPVIIRTTEEALRSVPQDLREASRAMGASKWRTIYKVVIPAAMGGIVTGAILSIGRAAGETAPIMLTAAVLFQPALASSIFDSVMALPLHLYHLAMDMPGTTELQYGTACVLMLVVLVFFIAASLIRSHYNKKVRW